MSKIKTSLKALDPREIFERLQITDTDLMHAVRFLDAYLTRKLHDEWGRPPNGVLAEALTLAIVVAYARPFTKQKNRRGQKESFDPSFLTAPLSSQHRGLHERFCKDRDTTFAHSDANPKNVTIYESLNGSVTATDHFAALTKSEAEELRAIIHQMRATLQPCLDQLRAVATPDQKLIRCTHCVRSLYTSDFPPTDDPQLATICCDCRHCDTVALLV